MVFMVLVRVGRREGSGSSHLYGVKHGVRDVGREPQLKTDIAGRPILKQFGDTSVLSTPVRKPASQTGRGRQGDSERFCFCFGWTHPPPSSPIRVSVCVCVGVKSV